MSGGRVELGLGAGWYDGEHAAYGIPFPSTGDRFAMLEEQLEIVTGLWKTPVGEQYSFAGKHHSIVDSPALPKPVQQPGPPIVMGGWGTKRTPRLAARYAAEFNLPFAPVSYFREGCDHVRAACEAIGRDPATMKFTVATVVCAGRNDGRGPAARDRERPGSRQCARGGAAGTPEEVVERILEFGREGAETVYLQYHTLDELGSSRSDRRGGTAERRRGIVSAALRCTHRSAAHVDRRSAVAVAADRGARVRLDLDLGPLLRGRRVGRRRIAWKRSPRTPRSRPRPNASRADRSCTRPATATPRCSRTRWRRSTRSRTGAPCSGSAAVG